MDLYSAIIVNGLIVGHYHWRNGLFKLSLVNVVVCVMIILWTCSASAAPSISSIGEGPLTTRSAPLSLPIIGAGFLPSTTVQWRIRESEPWLSVTATFIDTNRLEVFMPSLGSISNRWFFRVANGIGFSESSVVVAIGGLSSILEPQDVTNVTTVPLVTAGREGVFLIHGWGGGIDRWANEMAQAYCGKINPTNYSYNTPNATERDGVFLRCSNDTHDVYLLDWRSTVGADVDPTVTWPPAAAYSAVSLGSKLGRFIESQSYAAVHVIGHGPGAIVADSAVSYLEQGAQPAINTHLTLLDPYSPTMFDGSDGKCGVSNFREAGRLGADADFLDNYLEKRFDSASGGMLGRFVNFSNGVNAKRLGDQFKRTNLISRAALNFDLSDLFPIVSGFYSNHIKVAEWYTGTIENSLVSAGYGLTALSNSGSPANDLVALKGNVCVVGSGGGCRTFETVRNICLNVTTTNLPEDGFEIVEEPIGVIADFLTSDLDLNSASVVSEKENGLMLNLEQSSVDGDPNDVWAEYILNVTDDLRFIEFGYRFSGAPGGFLTVVLDDQPIARIEQGSTTNSLIDSGKLYLPKVVPGVHSLGLRLENSNGLASTIELSDIEFELERKLPPPVDDSTLYVIKAKNGNVISFTL